MPRRTGFLCPLRDRPPKQSLCVAGMEGKEGLWAAAPPSGSILPSYSTSISSGIVPSASPATTPQSFILCTIAFTGDTRPSLDRARKPNPCSNIRKSSANRSPTRVTLAVGRLAHRAAMDVHRILHLLPNLHTGPCWLTLPRGGRGNTQQVGHQSGVSRRATVRHTIRHARPPVPTLPGDGERADERDGQELDV